MDLGIFFVLLIYFFLYKKFISPYDMQKIIDFIKVLKRIKLLFILCRFLDFVYKFDAYIFVNKPSYHKQKVHISELKRVIDRNLRIRQKLRILVNNSLGVIRGAK